MIAIPNIDKPKGCGKCEVWSLCHYPKVDKGYDDKVMPDCPLIEIDLVRCGECKHWHDDGIMTTCDKHIGHGFPSDYFCADGERRSDEHNTERD